MIILWDLMDTLVRDPFFSHMAPFFGLTFEQLLAEKHPTAWRDFELGLIDEDTLYGSFFRDGRAIDGSGLKRTMQHGYAWIGGIETLLAELHARGVEMHLLSNYPPWYELCDAQLGVTRWVQPSFVSCRTGVRKPDPEAYLGACRALGAEPARCLFVDDRAPNVQAAAALGLDALHFSGSDAAPPRSAGAAPLDVAALRSALTARGLLS